MRGRPVADGVAWPNPSIGGAHAHYAYNSTAHMYCMRIANAQRRGLVNPRRACVARVTVVVLCVRVCVCVSTTILALQATRQLMRDTNSFIATRARKLTWRFC